MPLSPIPASSKFSFESREMLHDDKPLKNLKDLIKTTLNIFEELRDSYEKLPDSKEILNEIHENTLEIDKLVNKPPNHDNYCSDLPPF